MKRLAIRILACIISVSVLMGCGPYLKRRELESVAKDWSMVIRASQVIPVYPLTEDLQPGDTFLLTTPIQQQAKQYQKRGFLPLDQHITRLWGLDYQGFYRSFYGIGKNTDTPHHWQLSDPGTTPAPVARGFQTADSNEEQKVELGHRQETNWHMAPRAVFPSYTFKVKSGAGLKLAIPIKGVPVGLGLMQTDSATGSVSTTDIYVYGVSFDKLREKVEAWASIPKNRVMLEEIRSTAGEDLYLRVVNRVYLAGRVVVALNNDKAFAGELTAGEPQALNIIEAKDKATVDNYKNILAAINATLKKAIPGGEIKVAHASSRSVTLSETFDRPLVLGYLGFDFPVLKNGFLGAPVATQKRLMGEGGPVVRLGEFSETQKNLKILLAAINSLDECRQQAIYDKAAKLLGKEFEEIYREKRISESAAFAFSKTRNIHETSHPVDEVYISLKEAWEKYNE